MRFNAIIKREPKPLQFRSLGSRIPGIPDYIAFNLNISQQDFVAGVMLVTFGVVRGTRISVCEDSAGKCLWVEDLWYDRMVTKG